MQDCYNQNQIDVEVVHHVPAAQSVLATPQMVTILVY